MILYFFLCGISLSLLLSAPHTQSSLYESHPGEDQPVRFISMARAFPIAVEVLMILYFFYEMVKINL